MEEVPNNLIITAFNQDTFDVYTLLNKIENEIHHPFRIVEYFKDDTNSYAYALFSAQLTYFNTTLFLLKNFQMVNENKGTLFEQFKTAKEYLIKLSPPKMYILSIYSDEITTLQDIERLINARKYSINLEHISSEKLKRALHFSLEKYIQPS